MSFSYVHFLESRFSFPERLREGEATLKKVPIAKGQNKKKVAGKSGSKVLKKRWQEKVAGKGGRKRWQEKVAGNLESKSKIILWLSRPIFFQM